RDYVSNLTRELIGRGEAGEALEPTNPDVVESGIIVTNSGAKDVLNTPPQSTSGETAQQAEERESSVPPNDEVIQTVLNEQDPPVTPGPVPPLPPDPVDPPTVDRTLLPGVTGSAALANTGISGLTTGAGTTFVFTQVFEGSRIGVTADGEEFIIPAESAGFFTFDNTQGVAPSGGVSGFGFFDPGAEFLYTTLESTAGETGYFLSGTPSGALSSAAANSVGVRSYDLADDFFTGGAPFLPTSLSGFDAAGGTDLTLIGDPTSGAAAGGGAKALYGYLDINGAGPGQTTGLGVLTGAVGAASSGSPELASFFQGVFTDGTGGDTFITGAVASVDDGQGGSAFGPNGQYIALANRGDFGSGVETLSSSEETAAGIGLYGSATVATQNGSVDAANAGRGTIGAAVLNGYAAIASTTPTFGDYSGRNIDPATVEVATDSGANSLTADFSLDTFVALGFQLDDQINEITVNYGGANGESAYLNDQTFAARAGAGGATVNGGAATYSGVLASAGLVGDGGIFPQGVDTAPDHLTWGWWAGKTGPTAGSPGLLGQDFHLGAWVVGDLTAAANVPTTGTAVYEGFAAVSAIENGVAFVDGAGFNLTYDFGGQGGLGTVRFTDLLGDNPVIAVNAANGGYSGAAGINANGRSGVITVDGAFFNGGGSAGATAGGLHVRSNDNILTASGVSGGDRVNNSIDDSQ
ncbi:MAG: hypothetical protein AAF401_09925, partial [Pseudomonadota bacterium]